MENRYDPFLSFNPGPLTGAGNNTWLLDGAEPTLVDAGVGHPDHVQAIADALRGRPLARVLVTHGHADHASGVPALRARWPALDARKWLAEGDTTAGWRAVADGERIRAGDSDLVVTYTPGHAPDHVCFWDPQTRDLYAGDMLVAGSSVMIPAGRGGDLGAYLASLERLATLNPRRVLPGHGAIIEDPLAVVAAYIAHRRMREQQILAALDEGLTTTDEIVSRVYPELSSSLRASAASTVEAHLEKIRRDRRP